MNRDVQQAVKQQLVARHGQVQGQEDCEVQHECHIEYVWGFLGLGQGL